MRYVYSKEENHVLQVVDDDTAVIYTSHEIYNLADLDSGINFFTTYNANIEAIYVDLENKNTIKNNLLRINNITTQNYFIKKNQNKFNLIFNQQSETFLDKLSINYYKGFKYENNKYICDDVLKNYNVYIDISYRNNLTNNNKKIQLNLLKNNIVVQTFEFNLNRNYNIININFTTTIELNTTDVLDFNFKNVTNRDSFEILNCSIITKEII